MPGMFLRRPLFIFPRLSHQDIAGNTLNALFQTWRRSSQTGTQVGMHLHGKGEVELPFKPKRWSIHSQLKAEVGSKLTFPTDAGASRCDALPTNFVPHPSPQPAHL